MSEELDVNKMAAEFVTHNIENFYNTSKGVLKGAADTVRLHLNSSYTDYLKCIGARHSKAKSFFVRSEPTSLYDFYVPIGISSQRSKIAKASIGVISSINPFVVIMGSGGSGKTMLMRHLLLDAIKQKQKVPVFLELRELNQVGQSLLDFVKTTLHSNGFTQDDEYIEKALKAGHFALLFDGFDELVPPVRKDIRRQLLQLAQNYDRNIILLSSRPDSEFSGWPTFSVFQMDALTLDQACELIVKLPFDEELKQKFLKDLRERLFEKHHSFLSNPLLLSIMLLTYGQSADIPNQLSIFYGQAYEALFQRHDALKAGFKRERLTNLNVQEFERVFAALSIQTYDKRVLQMSRTQALGYVEKSKKMVGLDFNSDDYLLDAQQAVCLLIEDGLLIAFSHRSFQEYFAARFICNSTQGTQQRLLEKYSHNVLLDNTIQLAYEMNPELVEQAIIIPALEKLEQIIGVKRRVGLTHYLRFLKNEMAGLFISEEDAIFYVEISSLTNQLSSIIEFTLRNCSHLIGVDYPSYDNSISHNFDRQFFIEKYAKTSPGKEQHIYFKKLTARDEVVRDLSTKGGLYTLQTLELAVKIKRALIKKHKTLSRSLDAILGS